MRAIPIIWLALIGALLCLVSSAPVWADALADFEKARNRYEAGNYAEAADRFNAMLQPGSDAASQPELTEKVRTYYAACLIALGRTSEADAQIEAVLRANRSASPDPIVFPGPVIDRFSDVRSRIRQELEAMARKKAEEERLKREKALETQRRERERVAELERLAKQEMHVHHNSRWVAALPFGVGQFRNGQVALGWTLLVSETALATTTIVTSVMVQSLQAQAFTPGIDREALNSRVHSARVVNNASWAAWMALAVGGVAHAQLTFIPQYTTKRERPIPKPIVAPSAAALPGGALLGVQGSF